MRRKPKHGGRRKGAGAPRKPGAATSLLQVRVSAELLARIQLAADMRDTTLPNYVRGLLDAANPPAL